MNQGLTVRAVDIKPFSEWYQIRSEADNQQLDLSTIEACRAAVKGARWIYNLAADMGGMGFIENNKALCMLTVLESTHMLLAARDEQAERFFYSSSACVYAADKQTDTEVTALKESDVYPQCRKTATAGRSSSLSVCAGISRGLWTSDTRCPVPQRLRSERHLQGRAREGSSSHLPKGCTRSANWSEIYSDLGRWGANA